MGSREYARRPQARKPRPDTTYGHPRHRWHWRRLMPNPFLTEDGRRRFEHCDVPQLSAAQIWAECAELEAFLARGIFRGRRPRLIQAWPTPVDDHEWTLARRRVLRDELARRARR